MSDGDINIAVNSTVCGAVYNAVYSDIAQPLQPACDTLNDGQLGWRHRRAKSHW